jgi:hypothetical protein
LREFGQSHTGDHVYNFMHNLNINLEILFWDMVNWCIKYVL